MALPMCVLPHMRRFLSEAQFVRIFPECVQFSVSISNIFSATRMASVARMALPNLICYPKKELRAYKLNVALVFL